MKLFNLVDDIAWYEERKNMKKHSNPFENGKSLHIFLYDIYVPLFNNYPITYFFFEFYQGKKR